MVYTLKNAMRSEIFNFLWIKIITLLQWEVLRFFLTKCANVSLIVHIIDKKTNDYEKAKERLITGIKWWIPHFCNQHGVTTSSFSKWKQAVTSAIDKKIMQLSIKLTTENHKSKWWLKDIIITKVLKLFHNKFIVFLIDKRSGNAAFVC